MPDLPGSLVECDSRLLSDYEGVVVPLADLDCRSVFYIREDGNDKQPFVPLQKLFLELERQIYFKCKEQLASAKHNDGVQITVHFGVDTEIKEVPEELR
jgi:hypothetical protein